MPSFDIVSKVELHEIINAVDQANREIKTRFDFKDSKAEFIYADQKITLVAPSKFQLEQMNQILQSKLVKRNIDLTSLKYEAMQESLHEAKQVVTIIQGIEQEIGKKIVKIIKESKAKVQVSIMGEQVRVTGKKRDDLQETISLLRQAEVGLPLQYENFRD